MQRIDSIFNIYDDDTFQINGLFNMKDLKLTRSLITCLFTTGAFNSAI